MDNPGWWGQDTGLSMVTMIRAVAGFPVSKELASKERGDAPLARPTKPLQGQRMLTVSEPHRRVVVGALLACAVVLGASSAEAQYFGRNRVQYKTFKFEVLATEHFDVHFYAEEREAAEDVARMAERWYSRLSRLLDHSLKGRQPIVLYASHSDFEQTNAISGMIDEGTGGVTEALKRRVILPLANTIAETDHVLGHELVHAFQYDIAASATDQPLASSLDRLPLWFVEGMAEYLSVGAYDPHTAMWIRDASREEKLPEIDHLDDPRLFPYRWGQALWAYIAGRWGDDAVGQVYLAAVKAGSAAEAIRSVTGSSTKDLTGEWHDAIRAQYGPILRQARPASAYGRLLSGDSTRERGLDVSPSLSPDGKRIVYLSERGLLSIDLYLADVDSGRIVRRLVNTAVDPHYTSLQFVGSAGSWHPDGRQFVFAAVADGKPELVIVDVDSGRTVRTIPFPSLSEVLNPSWSPDGRVIVFSATSGGFSDLYLYDLAGGSLRQLTRDQFADLQPAWSPDGRRVAFVTDRFSTDLSSLDAGAYGLALIEPSTGAIEELPTVNRGKSINPQWASDGRLYFLSDQDGVTNVYVMDAGARSAVQLTSLDAGASGITALSPALSASSGAARAAFSAYDHGRLNIYIVDTPQAIEARPVANAASAQSAGALPPMRRRSNVLEAMLDDALTGLPEDSGQLARYRSRLSLDYVGQPSLGVGISSFGPSFGGGLSFMWSDMLGNHSVLAAVDANTYGMGVGDLAKNTGGLVAYQNLTHRWNWGLSVEQSPSLAGGFGSALGTVQGQPVLLEQTIVQRQTYRGANATVAYPFSRSRRVEFGAGYATVSFDEQVRTTVTSLVTGQVLADNTETTALFDPLNLSTARVAAVIDRSVFGATSPVDGERARFEVAPTAGSITFTTALADYRRYFMPARFYTIAGRVLHMGRYGGGGEDSRLLPLFIGYPELVRGYGIGSFTSEDCTEGPATTCQEFDRLLGSRLIVGNLEFRFPLLRPFGRTSGMYGPIPVEVAFFVDGGAAWSRGDTPTFLGGNRAGVSSGGVSLRVNLMGFAVGQIDFAKPFQRPGRGWLWGFSLTPGF
jgi:Tol biopolymer transport system component